MKTVFIVTEKPDAAEHVAAALHPKGKPTKMSVDGVPFFEVKREDSRLVVASALGHLFEVDEKMPSRRSFYPAWDFAWKPKHQVERGQQRQEKWVKSISKVAQEADEFVNACVAPNTLVLTPTGELAISQLEGLANESHKSYLRAEVVTVQNLSQKPENYEVGRCVRLEPRRIGAECFEIVTRTGRSVRATEDHRFMTPNGWKQLGDLRPGDKVAVLPVPELPKVHARKDVIVGQDQLWAQLRLLGSRQSRAAHSRYRYSSSDYYKAIKLREESLTYADIAGRTGLTLRTVRRWLSEHKAPYTVRNPAIEQLKQLELVPLNYDNLKIHEIARLMGAVFADGCLWQSKTKWYACGIVISCEKSGGAEEALRDLKSLGFTAKKRRIVTKGTINGRVFLQRSVEVRCNSLSLWLLLRALGAPSGSKADQICEVPAWVRDAPARIRYEFLSTYLGGELSVPTNTRVHPRSFNSADVRFNKREDLANNGRQFALQLASLLQGFGVRVTRITVNPSGVTRKDMLRSVTVRMTISNSAASLKNLLRRIPVQYCPRKRIIGDSIVEYSNLKRMIGSRKVPAFRKWAESAKSGLKRSPLLWEEIVAKSNVRLREVCDLTVNGAHSYVANGFLTHNCDYDIEGSLIGYMILRYACDGADQKAKRMKYSTLTEKELRDSFSKLMPQLDFPLTFAGMCRHEVDWLYGVNLSRALTQAAYKVSQQYATLSTGRVQGPTLRFIVERESEIATFVPVPYWTIRAIVNVDDTRMEAQYEKQKLEKKAAAESVASETSQKNGKIENLESKKLRLRPPVPFDLSALQSEAYRHFGFTPRASLGIAERLYLDALISYPRTSSQRLPPTIGYEDILRALSEIPDYERHAKLLLERGNLKPNEGKKEDAAHPAIYPTGARPKRKLDAREQKIFDIVVKRFMATFGDTALKQSERATIAVGSHHFFLRGSRILEKGWIRFYEPYAKFEEVMLPPLALGQGVLLEKVLVEEKYVQPPPRYNPSSLLKLMEEVGIGTKATRADIVDTLYRRGYVRDERVVATPLAFQVIDVLQRHCPRVVDVEFTRELEGMMEGIERGEQDREHVVLDTVENLRPVIEELKLKETEIGRQLTKTIKAMRIAERTLQVPCPQCGSVLQVLRSVRTRKRFIGCSGYFEKQQCRFALPLPQLGELTLLDKRCNECGFQMIQVRIRGRRPMVSCPRCFANRSRAGKAATQPATPPSTSKIQGAG